MMRQSEFKMKFDPELGRYTRQHIWSGERPIYGEGMMDVFKSVGKKIFGKTVKSAVKKGTQKAVTTAATKTGEHVGKKAGDKIVQMLSKEKAKPTKKVTFNKNVETINQQEIDNLLNNLLSGGSTRRRKII